MKRTRGPFNKILFLVLLLLFLLLFLSLFSFLWIRHCSKAERQALMDVISQGQFEFTLFSKEDNDENRHPATLIAWSKTSYSSPLFGEQVHPDTTSISLQEVAYFIVENSSLKTVFGQRYVQIVLCEIRTPYQDIPQEIKSALFPFRSKYYIIAIEGATLNREFYSIKNTDFLSKMLDLGINGLPGTRVHELFGF